MQIAIIPVAGISKRFNEDADGSVLKVIYTETDYKKTLLYSILKKCNGFDKVILVGGYRYKELQEYMKLCETDFTFPVQLEYNPNYSGYGTGYSLKVGLDACIREPGCDEITLIEGDLFFDEKSFAKVKISDKNVATYNHKVIYSNKAVIAYVDLQKKLHYVFSTSHGAVQIEEPFLEVYNSGQIWKFADMELVRKLVQELPDAAWEGTNLRFIEAYFARVDEGKRIMLPLEIWENCNTRMDYVKYVEQL